ncbi:MAG TPA: RagB/SusD family nutrient uptake outer membrane protein [Porphyromonadaceae bacterium]|nr:RagB/SusD family nutrient uptake outer membrane protein [Porphyromonadaceae bacterium]
MKIYKLVLYFSLFLIIGSCSDYLDILPDDQITDQTFWQTEQDVELAMNGIYNTLRNNFVYGYGGGYDACTPNAYQWAYWEGQQMQVGAGQIYSGSGGIVSSRWTYCYQGIYRANYFLENIDRVASLTNEQRSVYKGKAYFLRAVFYDLLAKTYGGVPLLLTPITTDEARTLSRANEEDVWNQIHKDYDEAIKVLPKDASTGHINLGAALGMKMKAYLYNSQWEEVLEYCNKIEALGKYSLFPSYHGLFQFENEGNDETIFSLSFMAGPYSQGSVFDRYWQPQNLKYGIDGSNSVAPIQNLVDAYETIDGSSIDPENPYENRDPRLDFTILRPGTYFQGQLYPDEIKNHTGQKVGFGIRKYTIETMQVKGNESPLDFMILRYGDVILCKAEALIELNRDIDAAIDLINLIRRGREDVKIKAIPKGLSQTEAREILRKERRIELALEGQYWDDIKRWNIGPEIYPVEVRGSLGELIQTKFPDGYNLEKDNYLPIPDSEISLNPNLNQNAGY